VVGASLAEMEADRAEIRALDSQIADRKAELDRIPTDR
jgi:hypothetical protein